MTDPSTTQQARAWVEIRLDRLRRNAASAQRAVGRAGRLVPMVKADAYGLGLEAVARALREIPGGGEPWAFGVATVDEGLRLRAAGWNGRILVLPPTPPSQIGAALAAELTLSVSEVAAVRRLADLAPAGRRTPFHLEIDTGMGRAGFAWDGAARWGPEVAAIAAQKLSWEGTFTHFHSADERDAAPTIEQWERFRTALAALPHTGETPLLHVANSAATLRHGGFGCDLARPGIFLYGGQAGPGAVPEPVVSVRARLVLVRDVDAAATAGYGATYRAPAPERWGTVAIGYGDGIPRALAPARGELLLHGRRVPIIGRISMDMLTVRLDAVPEARVGDVCTVIGRDAAEEITVEEVAQRCGTISYEIFTGLGSRLPRVYIDGEPPAAPQG